MYSVIYLSVMGSSDPKSCQGKQNREFYFILTLIVITNNLVVFVFRDIA